MAKNLDPESEQLKDFIHENDEDGELRPKSIDGHKWKDNCDCCGKMFPCASKLTKHKREVHAPKQHCDHCSWTCRGKHHQLDKRMNKHLILCHPDKLKKQKNNETIQKDMEAKADVNNTYNKLQHDSEYVSQSLSSNDDLRNAIKTTEKTSFHELNELNFQQNILLEKFKEELDKSEKEIGKLITKYEMKLSKDKDKIKELEQRNQTLQSRCDYLEYHNDELYTTLEKERKENEEVIVRLHDAQNENDTLYTYLEIERKQHEEETERLHHAQHEKDMLYRSLDIERKEHEEEIERLQFEMKRLCNDIDTTYEKFINTAIDLKQIRYLVNGSWDKITHNLSESDNFVLQQKIEEARTDAKLLAEDFTKDFQRFEDGKLIVKNIIDRGKFAKGESSLFENERDSSDDSEAEKKPRRHNAGPQTIVNAGKFIIVQSAVSQHTTENALQMSGQKVIKDEILKKTAL